MKKKTDTRFESAKDVLKRHISDLRHNIQPTKAIQLIDLEFTDKLFDEFIKLNTSLVVTVKKIISDIIWYSYFKKLLADKNYEAKVLNLLDILILTLILIVIYTASL